MIKCTLLIKVQDFDLINTLIYYQIFIKSKKVFIWYLILINSQLIDSYKCSLLIEANLHNTT
jgi:hypothetical protein